MADVRRSGKSAQGEAVTAASLYDLLAELEEGLADEERILSFLIAAFAEGHATPAHFGRLHDAATRFGRVSELAAAYEQVFKDPRIKRMPGKVQSGIYLSASRFFADCVRDATTALRHAERSVAASPDSPEAFETLEILLVDAQDAGALARLFAKRASTVPDTTARLGLLRRGLALLQVMPDAEEPASLLQREAFLLNPTDEALYESLVRFYESKRRFRDLAKLLEDLADREPAPSEAEADTLRLQLVALYRDKLHDAQRALAHLEPLLGRDEIPAAAIEALTGLSEARGVAARAAALLSDVYGKMGRTSDEAAALERELALAKPPRLLEVQRRLGMLRLEVLGDPQGALALVEPLLAKDPSDDQLRKVYLELCAALGKSAEAARMLLKAQRGARDAAARARIGLDIGNLYLAAGDGARAREAFSRVLDVDARSEAALDAAHKLAELETEPGELFCRALSTIVELEQDTGRRHEAASRLAELASGPVPNDARAIIAWRALLDSDRAMEAARELGALCERTGDQDALADVLEFRAMNAATPGEGQAFAFRSAEIRSSRIADAEKALSIWRSFVTTYGPSREAHAKMLPLLERAGDLGTLAAILEREIELATEHDRARLWAELARLRLVRLRDRRGALLAFEESLRIDPDNHASRTTLEQLLGDGELRGEAANILEPIYRAENNLSGQVRVLETRAQLSTDAEERLSVLDRAVELAGQARDFDRCLALCKAGLGTALDHRLDAMPVWVERLMKLDGAVNADQRAELLVQALGARPIDSPALLSLACATGEALLAAGHRDAALEAFNRALAFDATSPELLRRLDALLADQLHPEERLARFEGALWTTDDPIRRRELLHGAALLRRDTIGDVEGAVITWEDLAREEPSNAEVHQALTEAYSRLRDYARLEKELERGTRDLSGVFRQRAEAALARLLAQQGERERAQQIRSQLVDEPDLDEGVLLSLEEAADDDGDVDLLRRALERHAETASDPLERSRALERLGDLCFEQLGDERAAIHSWRAVAELDRSGADPEVDEHVQHLYERILEVAPNDREAAEQLLELYVREKEWTKIPSVYSVLMRGSSGRPRVDLVLSLEQRALEAGAVDEIASMIDEALWSLGPDTTGEAQDLLRAKARVLSSDIGRHADAIQTYQALIEAYGVDSDIAQYEKFIDAMPSVGERREASRWLNNWRVEHLANPVDVLLDWARLEEQEYDDTEAAVGVYQRVLEYQPAHADALAALARLRLGIGDLEGGARALRALRDLRTGDEQRALDRELATLLIDRLNRPREALFFAAPLLRRPPLDTEALRIVRTALASGEATPADVGTLEKLAGESQDAEAEKTLLRLLLEANTAIGEMSQSRRRWHQRLLDLSPDAQDGLTIALGAALEFPTDADLWERVERLSRRINAPDAVEEAYFQALERVTDGQAAELIGRRLVEFHDESSSDASRLVRALKSVLAHAPSAKWALDRIKLSLSAEGRWDELLDLYDRALEVSRPAERLALLDEAALAARDFASRPDRAIVYIEALRELRPNDARLEASLERLYERQGHTDKLLSLLSERLARTTEPELSAVRRRMVGLCLDLGDARQAMGIVEELLGSGTKLSSLSSLLEGIHSTARAAGETDAFNRSSVLLKEHYRAEGEVGEVARIAATELSATADIGDRARRLRELVSLRLEALGGGPEAFSELITTANEDVGNDEHLAKVLAECVLHLAVRAWPVGDAGAQSAPAAAAWWAVHSLAHRLLGEGNPERAVSTMLSGANLPFERSRQRELLGGAARLCSDTLDDNDKALEILRELFGEDPTDQVAVRSFALFEELLGAAGEHEERIALIEEHGGVLGDQGDDDQARALFRRAGELWEGLSKLDRAIAAHRRGAALGEEGCLEALAKIYSARKQWQKLAEVLEWLYATASADKLAERALALADVYLDLDAPAYARARLEGAAGSHASPKAQVVRDKLAQLYREGGLWGPLADHLSEESEWARSDAKRVGLLVEASTLHLTQRNDPAAALPLLERAVTLSPRDRSIRQMLAEAQQAVGLHEAAVETARACIESYEGRRPKERALSHRVLARALSAAGRPAEALAELSTAAEINPTHLSILRELGDLALSEGDLERAEATYRALLLALHQPTADAEQTPSHAEVYLSLSELAARRGDESRAADLLESAFEAALHSDSELESLERVLRHRHNPAFFARVLEARLRTSENPVVTAQLLADLVALRADDAGGLGDFAKHAATVAERVLEDLEKAQTVERKPWNDLAAIFEKVGDPKRQKATIERYAATLTAVAQGADPAQALELLEQASDLHQEALSDPERALTSLETELQVARQHGDRAAAARASRRLGKALERAGRPADALAAYEAALAVDSTNRELVRARVRVLEALGSAPGRLADALERLLEVEVPAERVSIAERLASLRNAQGDAEGALRALEAGFYAAPSRGALREQLVARYRERGDWAGAARILERGLEANPADKTLLSRLVEAYRNAGELEPALAAVARGIAARPADSTLYGLRASVYQAAGNVDAAVSDLESAYSLDRRQGQALLTLLESIVASPEDHPAYDRRLERLAELLTERDRTDEARKHLLTISERRPGDRGILERLADLALRDEDWVSAVASYERLASLLSDDDPALVDVALKLADASSRAGSPERAQSALERAVRVAPSQPELRSRLRAIHAARGGHRELVQLTLDEAQSGTLDRAARVKLLLEAAETLDRQLGDPNEARRVLEQAQKEAPEDLSVALRIAEALQRSGHRHEARQALSAAAALHAGERSKELASIHHQVASLDLEEDELHGALDALKLAFDMDPKRGDFAVLLGLVATDLEDDATAVRALRTVVAMPAPEAGSSEGATGQNKALAYYVLGRIARGQGDGKKAQMMVLKALREDPTSRAARALLEELSAG